MVKKRRNRVREDETRRFKLNKQEIERIKNKLISVAQVGKGSVWVWDGGRAS